MSFVVFCIPDHPQRESPGYALKLHHGEARTLLLHLGVSPHSYARGSMDGRRLAARCARALWPESRADHPVVLRDAEGKVPVFYFSPRAPEGQERKFLHQLYGLARCAGSRPITWVDLDSLNPEPKGIGTQEAESMGEALYLQGALPEPEEVPRLARFVSWLQATCIGPSWKARELLRALRRGWETARQVAEAKTPTRSAYTGVRPP
jgi:hypothetical protein